MYLPLFWVVSRPYKQAWIQTKFLPQKLCHRFTASTCHLSHQTATVFCNSNIPEVSLLLPNMDFLPQSTLFSSLCKWLQRLVQVHGREIVWGGKLSKGELVCCSQFSSARGSWPESKFGEYIWVALVIVILLQCIISSNSWESVLAHLSHSRNSSLQRQEGLMN